VHQAGFIYKITVLEYGMLTNSNKSVFYEAVEK